MARAAKPTGTLAGRQLVRLSGWAADLRARKIPLVEDEVVVTRFIQKGMAAEGYELRVAYDGLMGWAVFDQRPFDVATLAANLAECLVLAGDVTLNARNEELVARQPMQVTRR